MRGMLNIFVSGGGLVEVSRVRYIQFAHFQAHELEARLLFSDEEIAPDVAGAVFHADGGHENECVEIIVSLADVSTYRDLGADERERLEAFRSLVRRGVNKLREAAAYPDAPWVASIHLNTEQPHAHLLLPDLLRLPGDWQECFTAAA